MIHMEEVIYAGIDRSCSAVEWMNSPFPADRLTKLLSLSDSFSPIVSFGGNRPEISVPVETVAWDL